MEISPMIHDAVCTLLEADGHFELGPTIKDLARLPRVVQARRRGEGRGWRGGKEKERGDG